MVEKCSWSHLLFFFFGFNRKHRFNLSELKHCHGLKHDEKKCAHLGGLPQKYLDPSSKILRASGVWRLVFYIGVLFFPGKVLFFTGVYFLFSLMVFRFSHEEFLFSSGVLFFLKKIPCEVLLLPQGVLFLMWCFIFPTLCLVLMRCFVFQLLCVVKWRTLQVARGSGQDRQDPSRFIRSPLWNSEKPEPRADGESLFQEVPENSSSLLCPIHFVPLVPVQLKYFYLISPAGTGLRIF